MLKKYLWWILAVIWCFFIFYQSGKPAIDSSAESSFITDFINQMHIEIPVVGKLQITENEVRKTAHFMEYFVLGILLFNCTYVCCKTYKAVFYAVLTGIFYAETDEIHQFFVPGRAMMIQDVFIDAAGIIVGALLMCLFAVLRIRRREPC